MTFLLCFLGAAPYFPNLPNTITITSTTPIGTNVFQVQAADNNTLNTLTMNLVRQCPEEPFFAMDKNGLE